MVMVDMYTEDLPYNTWRRLGQAWRVITAQSKVSH